MRGRHFLTALGINAVPAAGWFAGDWSPGTTLALYWLETLLGTLLLAGRILLHRRICPSRGHWEYEAPRQPGTFGGNRSTFLVSYLVPAVGFTAFHGFFLTMFGGFVMGKSVPLTQLFDVDDLLNGLLGIASFQVLDFALDLFGLRKRPFHWIERLSLQNMARVVITHLMIIGGMFVAIFLGARGFFSVFIVTKALLDCNFQLPQWKPKTPPRWLCALLNRMRAPGDKETFEQFYAQGDDEELNRRERNERVCARPKG